MKPHEIEQFDAISIDGSRATAFYERVNAINAPWLRSGNISTSGVDGKKVPPPWWWTCTAGGWGCYLSHLRVIEGALNQGRGSVLIFEDDAFFIDDFVVEADSFFEHIPGDWEMAYLGGQHMKTPELVNDYVTKVKDARGLHAYALRDAGIRKVYLHLTDFVRLSQQHDIRVNGRRRQLDEWAGELTARGDIKAYAPAGWMVGQVGGVSSISGQQKKAYIG